MNIVTLFRASVAFTAKASPAKHPSYGGRRPNLAEHSHWPAIPRPETPTIIFIMHTLK